MFKFSKQLKYTDSLSSACLRTRFSPPSSSTLGTGTEIGLIHQGIIVILWHCAMCILPRTPLHFLCVTISHTGTSCSIPCSLNLSNNILETYKANFNVKPGFTSGFIVGLADLLSLTDRLLIANLLQPLVAHTNFLFKNLVSMWHFCWEYSVF